MLCKLDDKEHSKKMRSLHGRWDVIYCTECDLEVEYETFVTMAGIA